MLNRLIAVACGLFLLPGLALSSASGELRFSIEFEKFDMRFEEVLLPDGYWHHVTLDGLEEANVLGHPLLPVKSINFYVPKGKIVKEVRAQVEDQIEIPGNFRIAPAQPEIPLSSLDSSLRDQIIIDQEIYKSSEPYPASPCRLASTGTIGGRRIGSVVIYPIQYIPGLEKILFNRKLSIEVVLQDSNEDFAIPLETQQVRQMRNGMVKAIVENPGDVEKDFPQWAAPLEPSSASEYLIICLANHADEYEVLRQWKTRKGVPATIVTIEDALASYTGRDDPEKLRNCIKDYYLNHSTTWVLMTLSAPKAKIRGCYGRVGETVDPAIPCDLYFADMDGDWNGDNDSYWGETNDNVDLYPDVYVGRITANTGAVCTTVVNKVLTYEGVGDYPTDYQLDMLFMAEYLDEITNAAVLKNKIDTESVPSRFDPITKLYESSGNLNRDTAIAELNAGKNLVNHAGHGNVTLISIGDDILTSGDMENLTNAPRFSVFYTLACDPGAFDNIGKCFARAFLEAENGGGFIIANSRYGWYWAGKPGSGTGDLYDREFFKSIFLRNKIILGIAHADAKIQRIPYSQDDGTNRWTMFSLNLFGDPETPIWIDIPQVLTVSHPENIGTGSQIFTVSVSFSGSPVDSARVCLWKDEEIYLVGLTSGGSISFSIDPQEQGEMLVTVTKTGYLPYLGTAIIEEASGVKTNELNRISLKVSPNPVIGSTRIRYYLPAFGDDKIEAAVLRIVDVTGRIAKTVEIRSGDKSEGIIEWDGRTDVGEIASSGIYFVDLTFGDEKKSAKILILR
ncbi:MAG: C25 family cysteine peptidase [bacterium]